MLGNVTEGVILKSCEDTVKHCNDALEMLWQQQVGAFLEVTRLDQAVVYHLMLDHVSRRIENWDRQCSFIISQEKERQRGQRNLKRERRCQLGKSGRKGKRVRKEIYASPDPSRRRC